MAEPALALGLVSGLISLAILIWSIRRPEQRLWPPLTYSTRSSIVVWVLSLSLVGPVVVLGITGWGNLDLPVWLRWWVGPILLVLGNAAVWREVLRFGYHTTGGAPGKLHTDGLYRYSRNPQYVADAVIVVSWVMISASASAIPVAAIILLAMYLGAIAEEPWLEKRYGDDYCRYKARVRRFL